MPILVNQAHRTVIVCVFFRFPVEWGQDVALWPQARFERLEGHLHPIGDEMPAIYFSDFFGVEYTSECDWFNPILGNDTRLFIDPFEIYAETGDWSGAHAEVIAHFQRAMEMLAPVIDRPSSPAYQVVAELVRFPEPPYFGFGYVEDGQDGAGGGRGLAARIVKAMTIAIREGLQDISHFEELAVLVPLIGPDRISDTMCNILGERFVRYTERVCAELGVPCEHAVVPHMAYDTKRLKWVPVEGMLPINPVSHRPLLLTPKRFLDELPTMNPDDWFDHNAEHLRARWNLDLNQRLSRPDIVKAAQAEPLLVRQWAQAKQPSDGKPYDVDTDPVGLHNWLELSQRYVASNPLSLAISSNEDLMGFIEECVKSFKHFVEQEGGWVLLRNDDTGEPKREESIQLLFKGVVQNHCRAAGVMLDREVEVGRGPVDFKFSKNLAARALLEVKKMSHKRFWDGLENQLVIYMEADQAEAGWFLPVMLTDTKNEQRRLADMPARIAAARHETGFDLRAIAVDGRRPKSASTVKS